VEEPLPIVWLKAVSGMAGGAPRRVGRAAAMPG